MERISAASNLIIEVQPESWRLLTNGNGAERVLVEAVPGEPLRYGANFGSRRQLPDDGLLPREDIQSIVLGWSEKDDAWHLGLLLKGDLVTQRGSRWCGLAHWHDPLANQYQTIAVQAGQTLAEQVKRPFTLIPPHSTEGLTPEATSAVVAASAAATQEMLAAGQPARIEATTLEPIAEPIPQPALPLTFDLWTLNQLDPAHLQLALSPAWARSKLLRVAWNIIWWGVLIVLTGTTLTSGIALPRPEFLVYLGFASIILLTLLIIYNLYEVGSKINRIVFGSEGIHWMRNQRSRHAIPVEQINAIYVSHVISKVGRRGKSAERRTVQYGEINVMLKNGKFELLLTQHHTDDVIPVTDDPLNEETVVTLSELNARTQLQAAALRLAKVLNVPAEYDKRLK